MHCRKVLWIMSRTSFVVYKRNIFTIKDSRFKNDSFLDEVKRSNTDLINIYVRDDKEKLKVFDKNGVYLPMKNLRRKYYDISHCNGKQSFKLTFEEIQNIAGIAIDHSFLKYKKELIDYGYEVEKISMKEQTVIFNKIG